MKKTLLVVATTIFMLSNASSYSQKSNKTIGSVGTLTDLDMKNTNSCTVNGVEITSTGSYSGHAYIPPTGGSSCLSMAVAGGQPWTGHDATGFITYTFSVPVINATIGYSVVNPQDVGQITIDGASPVNLTNPCGVTITGPDTIQGNSASSAQHNDVSITVFSATPFTEITLYNISADSGWVSGNLCNFTYTLDGAVIAADGKYSYSGCSQQLPAIIPSVYTNLGGSGNPVTIDGAQASASNAKIGGQSLPSYLTFNQDGTLTVGSGAPSVINEQIYFKICMLGGSNCTSLIPYHIDLNLNCRAATETALSIQPNPSKDTFVVNFGTVKDEVQLEVYDFYGKLYLKTQASRLDRYTINAQDYPKGTYVLKIIDKDAAVTRKLIKE